MARLFVLAPYLVYCRPCSRNPAKTIEGLLLDLRFADHLDGYMPTKFQGREAHQREVGVKSLGNIRRAVGGPSAR